MFMYKVSSDNVEAMSSFSHLEHRRRREGRQSATLHQEYSYKNKIPNIAFFSLLSFGKNNCKKSFEQPKPYNFWHFHCSDVCITDY